MNRLKFFKTDLRRKRYGFILTLLLFSCTSKNGADIKSYDFEINKTVIDFGETLTSPVFGSFYLEKENQMALHSFVDGLNNIVYSDIEAGKFVKEVKINTGEGPESINGGVKRHFPIEDSNYLIESYPFFYIINEQGDVVKKQNMGEMLNNLLDGWYNDHIYLSSDASYFRVADGEYILRIFRFNDNFNDKYPTFPLFVKLKIDRNLNIALEPLEVFFPEEFKLGDDLSYVQSEKPSYIVENGYLIYGFNFSSKVFMYHLDSKSTTSLNLEIEHGTNFSPPDENYPISITNRILTSFVVPLVDFESGIIYRFHIDINDEDPMESTNYLTAFDFEEKKLIEYRVGTNGERMLRNPFLYKGEVYVNPFFPEKSDEILEFYRFKLVEK